MLYVRKNFQTRIRSDISIGRLFVIESDIYFRYHRSVFCQWRKAVFLSAQTRQKWKDF